MLTCICQTLDQHALSESDTYMGNQLAENVMERNTLHNDDLKFPVVM